MNDLYVSITPTFVHDQNELRDALKQDCRSIIVNDRAFFDELEKKLVGSKAVKVGKKIGNVGTVAAVLFGGIATIGAVAAGNVIVHLLDKFKNYDTYIDYTSHRILFLVKDTGSSVDIGEEAKSIIEKSTRQIKHWLAV